MTEQKTKFKKPLTKAITALEFILGFIVVLGTAWYLFVSVGAIFPQSSSPLFFQLFIDVLLTAIIGVEVARVLVTHNLVGIIEILGLVMARKVIAPEATAFDLLLVVIAFGILVFVRKILIDQKMLDPQEIHE